MLERLLQGRLLTRDFLVEEVWGRTTSVTPARWTCVERLRRKLGRPSLGRCISGLCAASGTSSSIDPRRLDRRSPCGMSRFPSPEESSRRTLPRPPILCPETGTSPGAPASSSLPGGDRRGCVAPVLERVKFVAIFANNLDEFFQVLVAGLQEQVEAGVQKTSPDGRTPAEQLGGSGIGREGSPRGPLELFTSELAPALEKERIRIVRSLDGSDRRTSSSWSRSSPRTSSPCSHPFGRPGHPFPYISSLSLNLAAIARDPMTGVRRFARVKVPPLLPRFVALPDGERFVPLEDVIAAHLDRLFPGMEIVANHAFRATRDADVEVEEDEAGDLLEAIQSVLRRRRRGASSVTARGRRDDDTGGPVAAPARARPRGGGGLRHPRAARPRGAVVALRARPAGAEAATVGAGHAASPRERGGEPDLFGVLRNGDVLVHHPYDSFTSSIEAFIEQAALDPDVLAIKQDDVPDLDAGEPHHPVADPRRRARQAGRCPGRAEGSVRRGAEHHLCARARAGGCARRVRRRGVEDAREDLARRPPRAERGPSLRPRRHREPTTPSPPGSTRTSGCSPPIRTSAPT